jgi:hypothetical protein
MSGRNGRRGSSAGSHRRHCAARQPAQRCPGHESAVDSSASTHSQRRLSYAPGAASAARFVAPGFSVPQRASLRVGNLPHENHDSVDQRPKGPEPAGAHGHRNLEQGDVRVAKVEATDSKIRHEDLQ